jgi:hypothetical protein
MENKFSPMSIFRFAMLVVLYVSFSGSLVAADESVRETRQLNLKHRCPPANVVEPIRYRIDLGHVLRARGAKIGAELGVQQGVFAESVLTNWANAEEYVLVDIWAHQDKYEDQANVDQRTQNVYYDETMKRMDACKKKGVVQKITVCRNFTLSCVDQYPDEHFDFVYVDARHDYKAVLEDLRAWWPKVKMGGIMAGHDYTLQDEPNDAPSPRRSHQDWTKNYDGTIDTTGRVTKGAVDDFFHDILGDMKGCPRQLTISYREPGYNTWVVGK